MTEPTFEKLITRGFMTLVVTLLVTGCNLETPNQSQDALPTAVAGNSTTIPALSDCRVANTQVFRNDYANPHLSINLLSRYEKISDIQLYLIENGEYRNEAILHLRTGEGEFMYAISENNNTPIPLCDVTGLQTANSTDWAYIAYSNENALLIKKTDELDSMSIIGTVSE